MQAYGQDPAKQGSPHAKCIFKPQIGQVIAIVRRNNRPHKAALEQKMTQHSKADFFHMVGYSLVATVVVCVTLFT